MSQVKGAIGHGRALLAVYAFSRRPHALFYQALALRSVSSLRQENREASAFSSSTGSLNHSNEPQVHNMSIFSSIRGGATVNERAMAQGNDTSIERKDSRYSITEFFVQFIKGTKTLWAEIGAARETRARKKVGESLTLQEERLLRQVSSLLAVSVVGDRLASLRRLTPGHFCTSRVLGYAFHVEPNDCLPAPTSGWYTSEAGRDGVLLRSILI